MKDILTAEDGQDLRVEDSATGKAANVLKTQINTLEYAPTFGVDLAYFLDSELQFQNEAFQTYLVQRLTEHQINVAQVVSTVQTLFQQFTLYVGESRKDTGGLIR